MLKATNQKREKREIQNPCWRPFSRNFPFSHYFFDENKLERTNFSNQCHG